MEAQRNNEMGMTTILSRRNILAGAAFVALAVAGVQTAAAQSARVSDTVKRIADHFSSIRTMSGEFVQFGPKGEQTGGKFFIQRPGKIRFNYESPSAYRVTADGNSVSIENRKLKTLDIYPLSKTPLKLLLDERIDLTGGKVASVKEDADMTTIKLADKSIFGNSNITMMFDPKTNELRQWTITDAKGKDTTVMIFNVRNGVSLDPKMFVIDYRRFREQKAQREGRQ